MNKTLNTVLFIIGGTIFILIITGIILSLPLAIAAIIYGNSLSENESVQKFVSTVYTFWPLVAIIGGFIIYNFGLKQIAKKVDMEKYFSPLLWKKKKY